MRKIVYSSKPLLSLLATVSCMGMLTACDMMGNMRNPFKDPRPPQQVEGMRRMPVLNANQPGPVAMPPAAPAMAAPPPPPPPSQASYETNPYDYFDAGGKPAPKTDTTAESKNSTMLGRLFGGEKSSPPEGPRKPFPGNPHAPRTAEELASPPPPPPPIQEEQVPPSFPVVKAAPPPPPAKPVTVSPPPVVAPQAESAPVAAPAESTTMTPPQPLPAATQALPWTGSYVPYDEDLPEEESAQPSDVHPLLAPPADHKAKPAESPLHKSWFERNFGAPLTPESRDPRSFDTNDASPPAEKPVVASEQKNWAEPQVSAATSPAAKAPQTASVEDSSWLPSWLGGKEEGVEEKKENYPALSSVPPVPPQFEAVKTDKQQGMENLQSDYIEAQQAKEKLDNEPTEQPAEPAAEQAAAPDEALAPAPVAAPTPAKKIRAAKAPAKPKPAVAKAVPPAPAPAPALAKIETPAPPAPASDNVQKAAPGEPVLLGHASAPLEPIKEAPPQNYAMPVATSIDGDDAQAAPRKSSPYWRGAGLRSMPLPKSKQEEEDENASAGSEATPLR